MKNAMKQTPLEYLCSIKKYSHKTTGGQGDGTSPHPPPGALPHLLHGRRFIMGVTRWSPAPGDANPGDATGKNT